MILGRSREIGQFPYYKRFSDQLGVMERFYERNVRGLNPNPAPRDILKALNYES